ncbi:arabinosyltransferase domain-containing protein [Actinomycetospora straminea]|uniref:Arabinosyltransferase domain-containing protein n=1 Tax=Actinomycetospora straminea TaxID=663607 RepID=A0ABP9E3X2_9PSEU|nr:arabinosyltransferase domain-containing protein [Actinomycetospora straminea]MDD7934646.1 arabinosyltransferase domain-containing protein [Actinomycetospora straminea]
MTATSRPSSAADDPEDTGDGAAPAGDTASDGRADGTGPFARGWFGRARVAWSTVATVAGIVALVCAALLPLLPVSVSQPEVAWPLDPADPRPTALQLTTQRPLALDVRTDCDAARAAASAGTGRTLGAPGDGVLLATLPPVSGDAGVGLRAVVVGDRLTVLSRGIPLVDGPLPAGPCTIGIAGDLTGMSVIVDGRLVGRAGPEAVPDVDALVSSVPPSPPGAGERGAGLAVRLTVDDQFATSPTAVKTAVTLLLLGAVTVGLVGLHERDRAARAARWETARDRPPRPRPRVVDGVVPLLLALWTVIGPMTDDDGYYAAMAANVPYSGYVANYYQLYNQGFTPFTWIYYVLSWWQGVAGVSPVVQRVPALLLGLASWFLLRAYAARALPAGTGRGRAVALHAVLALAFVAWWLPFDMGVRAEAVVATSVIASMLCLAVAVERDRWALAGLAVAVASFGATAAPTGFVALAPLLACLPRVWRTLIAPAGPWYRRLGVFVALVGPGALVGFAAFVDGSLRDFARGQQIFLGLQDQESWYTEIVRWSYLLVDGGPMGTYAKRFPVLLGLLALACLLALLAVARGRGLRLPPRLTAAAWTFLLGFALLWPTPSKWTHHFGTLATVGALVFALAVVGVPVLLREAATDAADPPRWLPALPVAVGVGLLVAVLAGLSGHGENAWPYSWMLGLPDPFEVPRVAVFSFDQPAWWLLGGLVLAGVAVVATRGRWRAWRPAVPAVAVALMATGALLVSTVYLVGGFVLATVRTADGYSPWVDAVRDPLARDCGASAQIEVLDPVTARPLAARPDLPSPVPGASPDDPPVFVPGGWFPSSPPPTPGIAAWGSFVPPATGPGVAAGADGTVGAFASPWYAIPERAGAAMTASVSGRTGGGNGLRVEYGFPAGGGVVPVGVQALGLGEDGEPVDSVVWRSLLLEGPNGPPPGATVMRLVADDTSIARGGWLAVTAPTVQRWQTLQQYARPGEATAVSWQYAFLFPCLRKPVQAFGINEPATLGVVWGDQPLAYRLDGIWQTGRGGLFAQSLRDAQVTQLATQLRVAPDAVSGQVYRLDPLVPVDAAYRLEPRRIVVGGWEPGPNTTMSVPLEERAGEQ